MDEVEQKLTAARTRLVLDKPFFGALVLRLALVRAHSWCKTVATDARSLYYNPSYVNDLNLQQLQFVLAHEALHCGLCHFARRMQRHRARWDIACDYAVNQILVDDKLELPHGALFNPEYSTMTAEEIYPCIAKDSDEEPLDQHLYDDARSNSQAGAQSQPQALTSSQTDTSENEHPDSPAKALQPPPLSGDEQQQLETQWQQRLAGAAQQARQAGKLSASLARLLEQASLARMPWRSLLAQHMSSVARLDYNFARPSPRREGNAILPSLHTRLIDIVVAIDTSGSIAPEELAEFVTEISAIKSAINSRITLLACDWRLDDRCPWTSEAWEAVRLPDQLAGGGGTDFRPVFDWLANSPCLPDLLVYFTDAKGSFPKDPPATSVVWLVKGNASVPWGQRLQLN